MSEPRDKFVDSQGLPIHYLEWGEPAGDPLILVHGYLDLAHSWTFFVTSLRQRLGKSLWIIAPDCRGHGDSGWVGAGGYYHFPDYVFDLDRLVRALGATQFKLIGHSMGGTISFLYAGTFPKRVNRLVLIEGIGPPSMKFSDAPLRMAKWITDVNERGRHHFRQYTSVEAGANQLRQTNPRLNDKWTKASGFGSSIRYTALTRRNLFTPCRLWNFFVASNVRCLSSTQKRADKRGGPTSKSATMPSGTIAV
jgi:pimeloyl-ACP methyl ester carboxylesterase